VREIETTSAEETIALGKEIGAALQAGDVVLLEGDLAAGKTTFVRGLAAARGVASGVKSPTFALMHRYRGQPDIVHIDLYRQGEHGGLDDLAMEEWGGGVIIVVEWPRDFARAQWPDALRIEFHHAGEDRRLIRVHDRPAGQKTR
jgi:tRNA threonylcarbamoyladenosine biosynthesis protein TsaE